MVARQKQTSLSMILLTIVAITLFERTGVEAWTTVSNVCHRHPSLARALHHRSWHLSSTKEDEDTTDEVQRTSFDDAGKSLIEEEDQKRLDQMGDFDSTGSQDDKVARMRAAIRERTAGMGIEKSQVSAEYIKQKEEAAQMAGPPGAQKDPESFGGLDLSQISDTKMKNSNSDWNDEMPTMFYDPEAELSKEEQEEADPLMLKNPIEQAMYEVSQSRWPTPLAAIREVGIMFIVIAVFTGVIVGWDRFLREFYTDVGFIPSKEDLANYASRFDGLDLPKGWMDNMSEEDVQNFAEKVNNVIPSGGDLPDL